MFGTPVRLEISTSILPNLYRHNKRQRMALPVFCNGLLTIFSELKQLNLLCRVRFFPLPSSIDPSPKPKCANHGNYQHNRWRKSWGIRRHDKHLLFLNGHRDEPLHAGKRFWCVRSVYSTLASVRGVRRHSLVTTYKSSESPKSRKDMKTPAHKVQYSFVSVYYDDSDLDHVANLISIWLVPGQGSITTCSSGKGIPADRVV